MLKLNLLDRPICLAVPNRLTLSSAWHEHIPFAMFLVDLLRPKMIVELGTHYGDSYCAFCQVVKELYLDTACYAVDTWQGDPQSGLYGPEVLADLRAHHDPLYSSFSRLIQSTFDEALEHFADGTVDLLHIDGYHTYESVRHDFEAWLPKMSSHGVVLLHDTNVREQDFGIRKFWDEVKLKYPHFEFRHGHGLGILAVGKVRSKELRELYKLPEEESIRIRDFFFQLGHQLTTRVRNKAMAYELENQKRQLQELNADLESKGAHITELEASLQEKVAHIAELETSLQEKVAHIAELETSLQEKVAQIHRLDSQIHRLDSQIQQIQRSIPMQLVNRYQRIVEKLLRSGTRRRHYYELMLNGIRVILNEGWRIFFRKLRAHLLGAKMHYYHGLVLTGIRVIRNEGWRSFWWKFSRYRALYKKKSPIKIKPLKLKNPLSTDSTKAAELINKKVSIVIPTKDAGTDFMFILERIRNQYSVGEKEIIVADSGSTDATVDVAEKQGAKVYAIKPHEFNHGLTRNYGAAQADGEYILFMVQDAIPIGNYWLYDMLNVLEGDGKIVAVTCRQVPRSDADLFASSLLWLHYWALDLSGDQVALNVANFGKLPPLEKRKLAGLEDVCCLIRKDIFDKFKFKDIRYAEDLDLGVRLRESGYETAFLQRVGVIHSHNRSASYLLRRGYADGKFLPKILSYEPAYLYTDNHDVKDIYSCIITLYAAINVSVTALNSFDANARNLIPKFRSLVQSNLSGDLSKLRSFERAGHDPDGILDEIQKEVGAVNLKSHYSLNQSYFDSLSHFMHYMQAYDTLTYKKDEFIDALYKRFSLSAGYALSNFYLGKARNRDIGKPLSAIDRILMEGV